MIFVDSSVLIDVIEAKHDWKDWSAAQLTRHAQRDGLAINAIVFAEISRSFTKVQVQDLFLQEAGIRVMPISNPVAFLAAQAHRRYRQASGSRTSTLPDFFIGAHACVEQLTLLTRDPVRIRTYFPTVSLISPDSL